MRNLELEPALPRMSGIGYHQAGRVSIMKRAVLAFLVVAWPAVASAAGGETHELRGRVVDESGKPAAGIEVTHFWQANGAVFSAATGL